MLANQHVRFGERVTGDPTRGNRSLLDRRARGVGWERLPHLFLPNYGCSASRSYAPSTQNADYGGVEEAARVQPKRSVTTFDDDEYVRDALRAGARGYLLKDIPAQDLAKAVHAVSQGVYQLDAAVIERMIDTFGKPATAKKNETEQRFAPPPSPPLETKGHAVSDVLNTTGLTNREVEILRLIATEATNREVADSLVISEGTVKNHLSNIFSRLGLRDRTRAVMYAREHGLL